MEDHFKTQTVPHPLGLVLLSFSLSLSLNGMEDHMFETI